MSRSFKERWKRMWQPGSKWLLGIPIGGLLMLVVGVVLAVGTYASIQVTSTNEFCTSCHSMQAFTYPEYQDSIHYKNAHGVIAECADCHIPKEWGPKIMVKTSSGLRDIYGTLTGKIDTREEYEEHRLAMAERVWERMRATDSRECRNCHNAELMDFDEQDRRTARTHQREFEKGEKTCIDCHTGVAHVEPEIPLPEVESDSSEGP